MLINSVGPVGKPSVKPSLGQLPCAVPFVLKNTFDVSMAAVAYGTEDVMKIWHIQQQRHEIKLHYFQSKSRYSGKFVIYF